MKRLSQFFRLININLIMARHGLDKVLLSLPLFSSLRFIIYFNPYNWFRSKNFNRAVAIRQAIEDLGPIFVKFGQAVSTRRDLLPDDIADELALLQDSVPPFPGKQAKVMIEQALGAPLEKLFQTFDLQPLASASIAQVHAAELFDGSKVVVKVLRPDVRKYICRDVDLLQILANLVEEYWHDGNRLRPREVVAEFKKTILDELDLMREAANASQLRRNFEDSPELYVPEIHWELCRKSVLVMERIHGIPVTDIEQLKQHKVNVKKLAERGVEIFFTQVFRDSFFHADMHPGNIFVSYQHPDDPQYISVDFGIIGTLNANDKRYLAENFDAFFRRDYARVAQLHVESGWVPYDIRVDEFESAVRTVSEPIFERPLSEISFAMMLLRLFQIGRRFNMKIQPQLMLLQKTLFAVEGLGRQLYPDLNLWNTAKPFLENWISQQVSPKAMAKNIYETVPSWAQQMPQLPGLIYSVLNQSKQQFIKSLTQQPPTPKRMELTRRDKRGWLAYGVGFTLLLIAGMDVMLKTTTIPFGLKHVTLGFTLLGITVLLIGWFSKRRKKWD